MNTSKVTRLEIIDHTSCKHCGGSGKIYNNRYPDRYIECAVCAGAGYKGRTVVFWDNDNKVSVEVSLQDNGRTLKVFINEKEN